MITISLNGNNLELENTINIQALLESNGYNGKLVAVALNDSFIPKSEYENHTLKNGDCIEIVAPMQGG